jgi:hypothetical protein
MPNESILETIGNEVVDAHSSTAAPDTPPSGPPTSVGADAQAPAVGATQPEWFEAAPPEIKGLLAHQNISAEQKEYLKSLYGDIHSIRETPIGTKEAIQELGTLFPGGMEDVRKASQDAQTYQQEMEMFRSADPAKQTELLSNLLTSETADAFVSLVSVSADMLRQTLRDDYTAFASKITRSHIDEVTDGNFSKFGDSTLGIATQYRDAVNAGNQDGASRIGSQLIAAALNYADWWSGSSKTKMGFGDQPAATTQARTAIPTNRSDANDPAIVYAQKDAGYFKTDYLSRHDQIVNPMIQSAVTRELGVRKMELGPRAMQEVNKRVADAIRNAIGSDPQYQASFDRNYWRGSQSDPRKWDNSDRVKEVLLAQAKQIAEKRMPGIVRAALDYVQELRGTPAAAKPAAQPAAAVRTSVTGPAAGAGDKSGGNWKDKLKAGQIDNAQALLEMTGQA